jgi:hypothetical protein
MTKKNGAAWMWVLLFAIVSTAVGSAQTPVVDCAVLNTAKGEITAFFGYTSNVNAPTEFPLLSNNFIDLGTVAGTIPAIFPRVQEHMLFSVRFPQTLAATWRLNGQNATANAQSVASPACQASVGATLPATSLQRCWDRNADHKCDGEEDVDGDGFCTILDCVGATGALGNTGSTGLPGNTGPRGAAGHPPQFQSITASPGSASATASCGTGQFLVTGGGACVVPNLPGMGRVASSAASGDGNGWSVSCSAGQATAVAICAQKP